MVRALTITGRGEKPTMQDVELAEPGPGQVRVTVEAASVNGIDAATAAGYLWDMMPHEFPVVLGRDFAGTVEAVGDGVTEFSVGDRVVSVATVMALGGGAIAQAVVVDAASLAAVPAAVTFTQAAAVGLAAVTAHDLLAALALTADDVLLVAGATGGVGAFAVQLAAKDGVSVLATARPGEAGEFVRSLGAHTALDYTDDLDAAVRSVAPDGVTAIVHAAGDAAALAALLRPGGRLASALGATGEAVGRTDVTVTPIGAAATPEKLDALLDAVVVGSLAVPVARTYPFEDAALALADFAEHKTGKIVITAQ